MLRGTRGFYRWRSFQKKKKAPILASPREKLSLHADFSPEILLQERVPVNMSGLNENRNTLKYYKATV